MHSNLSAGPNQGMIMEPNINITTWAYYVNSFHVAYFSRGGVGVGGSPIGCILGQIQGLFKYINADRVQHISAPLFCDKIITSRGILEFKVSI